MTGGFRFALARARATRAPLVTLAVVAALAALLVAVVLGVERTESATVVRDALASASDERAEIIVRAEGDAAQALAAVDEVIADNGLTGILVVRTEGGRIIVSPDDEHITADHVDAVADVSREVGGAIEDATGENAQVTGDLAATLDAASAGIAVRAGPTAVALGILGLIAAVVVGAVALEPVRARGTETSLLRARGARRGFVLRLAFVESLVIALAGAIAGAVTGVVAVTLLGGVPVPWTAAAIIAVATGLVAALAATVATWRAADRASGRARAAVDVGVAVVLAVVTGVAVWQFVQSGSPVVRRGDGASVIDPLVAIAPALALALAALVAVMIATPLSRGVAASLRRSRGVSPVTPLRLASRRPARHALSITAVAFAIGSLTVAGAYQGTIAALGDSPDALRVGADVRVTTIPSTVDPAELAATQPQDASMLTRSLSASGSDRRITVLAAGAGTVGDVMADAGGTVDPEALAAAISIGDVGLSVAPGPLTLTILAPEPPPVVFDGVEFTPAPVAALVRVTLLSSAGGTLVAEAGNADIAVVENEDGSQMVSVDVRPRASMRMDVPAEGEWRLTAIEVAQHGATFSQGTVEITDVRSAGAPVDVSELHSLGLAGSVEARDGGLVFTPVEPTGSGEPVWTRAVAGSVPASIPAVVSAELASSMGLVTGEAFSLEISTSPRFDADFVVAGLTPVLPGTPAGEGILVDTTALALASPVDVAANQVWFSSPDPAGLAAAISEAYPETVVLVADPSASANAAGTAVSFGLAAIGAAALALVVLVLRRTRSRADDRELALLALLGIGRRGAARVRAGEDLFAVVIGIVGGLAAGAFTAWLVVPALVRAAYGTIPDSYPVPLAADPVALGVALAAASVVFCAVVATVRAPARLAPLLREDE